MKNIWVLPFSIVGMSLLFATACGFNKFEKEIRSCDSLLMILDSSETILSKTDSAFYMGIHNDVKATIEGIENHYRMNKDTIPKKEGFMLSDYRLVFKGVKRFNQHYSKYKSELEYTKNQLTNLKTDLTNKAITQPLATRFLKEEAISVNELNINIRSFDIQNKTTQQKYQDQKPVMVQFLDSLNNAYSAGK